MTISVSLKGIDDTAYLEGDASASVSASGALEGDFALVVLGEPSAPLAFGGTDGISARAVRVGTSWQLVEMRAQAWFTWSQRVYVTASADAAMTVGFGASRVRVPAEPDAIVIVSMEDIGASIIPDVLPQNPREFLFPSDGSVETQRLIGMDWPEQGQRRDGFYIKPRPNNRARLSLGTTSSEFAIRQRDEVYLSVLARNEIFATAPAKSSFWEDSLLEIEHWSAGQAVAFVDISADKDPGLRFADGPTGSGKLELGAQKITVLGNIVRVQSFIQSRVEVRVEGAPAAAKDELGTTAATGPQDRFLFAMELLKRADLRKARAQIVYQSPLHKAYEKKNAFRERFNGVRVRGLGDARGIQALLDADLAVFELLESDDRFHLLAGTADAVPITGMSAAFGSTPSLQPKFDPETGTRRLDIAVGEIALRSKPTQDGTSPVSVDARGRTLLLNMPSLVADPVGVTARDAKDEGGSYAEWSLGLNKDAGFDALSFVLDDNGLSAPRAINRSSVPVVRDADKEWLANFQTENPNIEYVSVEEENMTVWIDTWFGKAEYTKKKTKIKVAKTPTGKEKRAYTQFFVTLGYALVEGTRLLLNKKWRVLGAEKLFIDLDKLDEETSSDFVKQNSLKDLLVTYDFSKGAAIKTRFTRWVEDNRPEPKDSHSRLLLPVGANVGVVLWDKNEEDETVRWMDTIAQGIVCPDDKPGCDPDTMLALDFSTESGLGPGDIGRDKQGNPWTSWMQIPEEDKILWPKARAVKNDGSKDNNKKGPRLDPSDRMWRGILFRNVPASIMIPEFLNETVTAKYPIIKQLLDLLQNRLLIRYGWRDANGATFNAGLVEKRKITPDSWDGILELYVEGLTVQGAPYEGKASTIVQAGGTVSLKAPWIGGDPDEPDAETPGIEGSFQLDLTSGDEVLKSLRVRLTGTGYEGPTIMPGLKKVKVLDFDTDFKTVNVVLALTADDTLAAALPFLADDEPMRASVYYNLSDDNTERDKKISLLLPTEIETKLFGRWDFTITHASFVWDDTKASEDYFLRFRGRLNLGLPAFSSLTADVTVRRARKAGSAWETTVNLELQGISVDLQIGDTRVQGGFEWARLLSDGSGLEDGPIPADDLVEAGREREFFASLLVQGGIFGNGWKLLVKSGNEAGKTYFIGLLEADVSIGFGSMAIERPALFLAHDADLYDSNKLPQLEKAFSDGRNNIIKTLRPTFNDQNTPMKYLSKWKPNDQMGTLVAVSGYLDTQSGLAEPADTEEYLTSIAYSDQGYFRVDAHAKLLGLPYFQRFALTLNTKRKYIEAGFAFPELAFSATSKKYLVNPGFYALGASYGEPFKVKSSLGWPALTGDDDHERDWSRATMVRIEGLWPINTFWGGVQTEVDFGDPKRFYFGIAVRAGWTWSYELNAADILKGQAELGVALGVVFEFEFQWDRAQKAFVPVVDFERPNYAFLTEEAWALTSVAQGELNSMKSSGTISDEEAGCIDFCLRVMKTAAEKSSRFDVVMRASIYADAWGSASVEFLGVTIVAGSLRAYVRFLACGSVNAGIQKLKGAAGFEFSVTILCVTYRTTARLEIVLKDDPCTIIGGNTFDDSGIELPKELKLIKEVA